MHAGPFAASRIGIADVCMGGRLRVLRQPRGFRGFGGVAQISGSVRTGPDQLAVPPCVVAHRAGFHDKVVRAKRRVGTAAAAAGPVRKRKRLLLRAPEPW